MFNSSFGRARASSRALYARFCGVRSEFNRPPVLLILIGRRWYVRSRSVLYTRSGFQQKGLPRLFLGSSSVQTGRALSVRSLFNWARSRGFFTALSRLRPLLGLLIGQYWLRLRQIPARPLCPLKSFLRPSRLLPDSLYLFGAGRPSTGLLVRLAASSFVSKYRVSCRVKRSKNASAATHDR